MSGTTTERLKTLLRKVLTQARIPADLRREIEATLARKRGQGRPRRIDPDEVQQLRAGGMSAQEIADKLGVTRAAIYKVLQQAQS